jgi:hypothetical protein
MRSSLSMLRYFSARLNIADTQVPQGSYITL